MDQVRVRLAGIVKVYPNGTRALDGADFTACAGEIHGLLGENGAGKTTLMGILAGLLAPTAGRVEVEGRPVRFRSARDALRARIGIVQQHLALVPTFSALDNILLGLGSPWARVQRGRWRPVVERLMAESGLSVPLDVPVEQLALGVRQRVEILKTLIRDVQVLILDEPTAVLAPPEVDDLFRTLRGLRERGHTVIFITHRLQEVLAVADRITVLRRGRHVATLPAAGASPEELARLMVGDARVVAIPGAAAAPGVAPGARPAREAEGPAARSGAGADRPMPRSRRSRPAPFRGASASPNKAK